MLIGTASFFGISTISKVTLYIALLLMYKRVYFNTVDTIIACIKERLDQPGLKACQSLEKLLIHATYGREYQDSLNDELNIYHQDVAAIKLEA